MKNYEILGDVGIDNAKDFPGICTQESGSAPREDQLLHVMIGPSRQTVSECSTKSNSSARRQILNGASASPSRLFSFS